MGQRGLGQGLRGRRAPDAAVVRRVGAVRRLAVGSLWTPKRATAGVAVPCGATKVGAQSAAGCGSFRNGNEASSHSVQTTTLEDK